MPTRLGSNSPRLRAVRALLTPKSRRKSDRFLFEGPTLLEEAHRSGLEIEELYTTAAAYERYPLLRTLERKTPTYLIAERASRQLSEVESPTGILAIGRRSLAPLSALLADPRPVLVLADLNDPGNAGTLIRSAEAFGAAGVIFGSGGVDPYHPKVVRAAMGSLFRLPLAVANAAEVERKANAQGRRIYGLDSGAPDPIASLPDPAPLLVVGQERRGLGPWKSICDRLLSIPAPGSADSLNASVAGSIALYQASLSRSE